MGNVLAMCGLTSGHELTDAQLDYLKEDSKLSASERSRAQSLGADTSVASILSHSDRLIPDAFQAVDIQVLSRGRRRSTLHSSTNSLLTPSTAGPPLSSSHVSIPRGIGANSMSGVSNTHGDELDHSTGVSRMSR